MQLPPFTPGPINKVYETFRLCLSSWPSLASNHQIPEDPRDWQETHVKLWLQWAKDEFNFVIDLDQLLSIFQMDGRAIWQLSKEEFANKTPGGVGDILYEHLRILQTESEQKRPKVEDSPSPPLYQYMDQSYQPPSHLYPSFQQHHHLYAGEQYQQYHHGYQPFIPPPPVPYYRPHFPVSFDDS